MSVSTKSVKIKQYSDQDLIMAAHPGSQVHSVLPLYAVVYLDGSRQVFSANNAKEARKIGREHAARIKGVVTVIAGVEKLVGRG